MQSLTPRQAILALTLAGAVAACGGAKSADESSTGMPAASTPDSLVALGEAQQFPPVSTKPETVFVDKGTAKAAAKPPTKSTTPVTPPATSKPPVTSSQATAPATATASTTVSAGHTIATTMIDSVHSRYTKVGDVVKVRVGSDVASSDGHVVIPAGSVISLRVAEIGMADSRGEKGTLTLAGTAVTIGGTSYAIAASATDYEYEMKARGISTGAVAKTGAGAAAGAILGRVIGGKKATVAGAIGGGMVGAAVASSTEDRDIIVHAGTKMTLTLKDAFTKS